jgi:hypothetical protein
MFPGGVITPAVVPRVLKVESPFASRGVVSGHVPCGAGDSGAIRNRDSVRTWMCVHEV